MRELIDIAQLLNEHVWAKMGQTAVHMNPTRGDFVSLMRNLRKKHALDPNEVVLRGFIKFHGNVFIFSAFNHTHDEAMEAVGDEWTYNDVRLSFWSDTGVVGVGTMQDAAIAKKNPILHDMMGGEFEVEECY